MKLTNEALKQIIKEELEAVLETYMTDTGSKGVRYKNPTAPSDRMTPDDAIGLLEFGWEEVTDDQKKEIEALADRLYNIRKAKGSDAFKKAKKGEYDTLIAAIKAAGGTFTPTKPVADENSKGKQ
mgnify:CR=1 FL=1